MRTPGITAKLFLAILGVTLAVVLLMTLATQLAFRSDLVAYLEDRERERIETLAEVLADYYRAEGGWQGLEQPARWRAVLREAAWRHRHGDDDRDDHRHDDLGDDDDDDEHRGERIGYHDRHWRGVPPWRESQPGGSIARSAQPVPFGPTLLDPAGRRVAGPPTAATDTASEPIRLEERTVGRLVYRTSAPLSDRLAREFQEQQLEAAWITALVVVLLAAGVSVLLARGFLAPVRRIADSTRALAAGRFDTRAEVHRRDELGRLAADFNRLAESLQRNERLRSELMADMSHELRTPMAVLRAELEAMEDGVRPLNRESLARLQDYVATLSKLIDDLYELSLADAGALNYRMAPLDLVDIIQETVESWRTRLEDAGLRLTLQLPAAPVSVSADARRLRQLLGNLLENSLRYTDAGGEVRIGLSRTGGRAILSVEDAAPGVPDEALQRLFERLYRVEGSRSRASGGAGLGLAICRNIVQAHSGKIEAYRAPLGGLGIRVTLPLSD